MSANFIHMKQFCCFELFFKFNDTAFMKDIFYDVKISLKWENVNLFRALDFIRYSYFHIIIQIEV